MSIDQLTREEASKAVTLTGYKLADITTELAKPLVSAAYKQVPHKSYLTSVDADYSRERWTELLGPYGIGFGLDWDWAGLEKEIVTRMTKDGPEELYQVMAPFRFWIRFFDPSILIEFPAFGVGRMPDLSDAVKGAHTSALKFGFKMLLFQIEMYTGEGEIEAAPPPTPEYSGDDPGAMVIAFKKAKELTGVDNPTILDVWQSGKDGVQYIEGFLATDKYKNAKIRAAAQAFVKQQAAVSTNPAPKPPVPAPTPAQPAPPAKPSNANKNNSQTTMINAVHDRLRKVGIEYRPLPEHVTKEQLAWAYSEAVQQWNVHLSFEAPGTEQQDDEPLKPWALKTFTMLRCKDLEAKQPELQEDADPRTRGVALGLLGESLRAVTPGLNELQGRELASSAIKWLTNSESFKFSHANIVSDLFSDTSLEQELKWLAKTVQR